MLVFADGFDHYQNLIGSGKWSGYNVYGNASRTSFRILPTSGRNGSGCAQFDANSGAGFGGSGTGGNFLTRNLPNGNTFTIGAAFNLTIAATGTPTDILWFVDGGTIQVRVSVSPTGLITLQNNGGTVLATCTSSFPGGGGWNYLETQVVAHASAGTIQVKLNGITIGNFSGLNTANSGTAQINGFNIGSIGQNGSCFAALIDDVYVTNAAGTQNTGFLGDVGVRALMPTGNGTTQNFTLNAAAWAASTEFGIGQSIVDSNGNIQRITSVVAASNAKTGGSPPTWATVIGNTTVDNNVTWTCIGSQSHWLTVAQNPPEGTARYRSGTQKVGDMCWDDNGFLQLVTAITGGGSNSGGNPPAFNTSIGGTTTDNQVTWTNIGYGEDLFLSDATVGDIERFTYPALTGNAVKAVIGTIRARKDDVSTRTIRMAIKSGATVGDSGTDVAVLTNYQHLQCISETDPNTGVAWTIAGVNAAEFGVKITS